MRKAFGDFFIKAAKREVILDMCLWKNVERAANLATIFAFLVAVWAVVFPASASKFLGEITKSSQQIADEIPFWLTLGDDIDPAIMDHLGEFKPGAVFAVPLENRANFIISDITVRVYDGSGVRVVERSDVFLAPFGGYTVYDSAPSNSFADGMTICISGRSSRADKYFYEKRVMRPEGITGKNVMMTTAYEFEDKNWPAGCSS